MSETSIAELERRMREWDDHRAIQRLVIGYAQMLDSRRFDEYEDFFTEDAEFKYGWGTRSGRDGMGALVAEHMKDWVATQHLITNHEFEITGSSGHGRASYLSTIVAPEHEQGRYWHEGGLYIHEYRRTDEGWKFSRLETSAKWVVGGDFSHSGGDFARRRPA